MRHHVVGASLGVGEEPLAAAGEELLERCCGWPLGRGVAAAVAPHGDAWAAQVLAGKKWVGLEVLDRLLHDHQVLPAESQWAQIAEC